jgi:hypothetical protein
MVEQALSALSLADTTLVYDSRKRSVGDIEKQI